MALGDNDDIARMATRLEFLIERVARLENQVTAATTTLATVQSEIAQLRREEQTRLAQQSSTQMTVTQVIWLMLSFLGIAAAITLAVYIGGRSG